MSTTLTVAAEAMATRFEVAIHGAAEATLRAAAEEALGEIARLESMLSLYQPTSEIAHINERAAHEAVPVSPELLTLLLRCRSLHAETDGAFDITITPLMRCWRFMNDTGAVPSEDAIAAALARAVPTGVHPEECPNLDVLSVHNLRRGGVRPTTPSCRRTARSCPRRAA